MHVPAMRSYASTHPMPAPTERRTWPTTTWVWRRYVTSMITVQTRSAMDLWDGLHEDPRWSALRRGGPEDSPPRRSLYVFLKKHGVRFPQQKAERIRQAFDRDFAALADEVRETFGRIQTREPRPSAPRGSEALDLAPGRPSGVRGRSEGVAVGPAGRSGDHADHPHRLALAERPRRSRLRHQAGRPRQRRLLPRDRGRPLRGLYRLGVPAPPTRDGVGFGWVLAEGV